MVNICTYTSTDLTSICLSEIIIENMGFKIAMAHLGFQSNIKRTFFLNQNSTFSCNYVPSINLNMNSAGHETRKTLSEISKRISIMQNTWCSNSVVGANIKVHVGVISLF